MGSPAIYPIIFLFVFGLIFALIGVISKRRAAVSTEWPTASGKIISSTIRTSTMTDGEGSTSPSYEPKIEYTYSVMGSTIIGHRIAFGALSSDYSSALKIQLSYPVGASVLVHYNPEDPSDSVLESKASGGNLFLILGFFFIAVDVVVAYLIGRR